MEITTPVLLTQPTIGQRADRSCTPLTDRPTLQPMPSSSVTDLVTTTAALDLRPGRSWVVVDQAGIAVDPSVNGVHATTMSPSGFGYADAVEGKGDRLGLPAWSPPV